MELSERDIKRFRSKFVAGKDDECWNWNGTLDIGGYGKLSVSVPKHTTLMAHRVSYTLYVGNIADGMIVMHKCDNPQCVNPNHLTMGTQKENVTDCGNKNRRSPQDKNNNNRAILNEQDVIEIKKLYETGEYSCAYLGKMYGVAPSTVKYALVGKSWNGVGNVFHIPKNKINRMKRKLLKEEIIFLIDMLLSGDFTIKDVANKFSVTTSEVYHICKINNIQLNKITENPCPYKLSKFDVMEIRDMLKLGLYTQRYIAKKFNVSPTHIGYIKSGKSWGNLI